MVGDLTAVTFNFKALDLVRSAVAGFRQYYPVVPLLVVDDGSNDDSTEFIRQLAVTDLNVSAVIRRKNQGHGPGFDLAARTVPTRYMFTFDTDVTFLQGGFLEIMLERMRHDGLYACGLIFRHPWWYIHGAFGMYDTEIYKTLPPAVHDGSPLRQNMATAQERGIRVEPFREAPLYVIHHEKGSRGEVRNGWNRAEPGDPDDEVIR